VPLPLLVDERPEEVDRHAPQRAGHVFASSNDNSVEKHLDLAQLVIGALQGQWNTART